MLASDTCSGVNLAVCGIKYQFNIPIPESDSNGIQHFSISGQNGFSVDVNDEQWHQHQLQQHQHQQDHELVQDVDDDHILLQQQQDQSQPQQVRFEQLKVTCKQFKMNFL